MHFQRFNVIPVDSITSIPLVQDTFNIVKNGAVIGATQTNTQNAAGLFISYVSAPGGGGTLDRNFIDQGFAPGLITNSKRNRYEFGAKLANTLGSHTLKYGFEYNRDIYNNDQISTGTPITYGNPLGLTLVGGTDVNQTVAQRISNRFNVCTTRGNQIVCPSASAAGRANLIAGQAGFSAGVQGSITAEEALHNPFLVLSSVRVRDFILNADTNTNVESFYVQDEWKVKPTFLILGGLRWDFQQALCRRRRDISEARQVLVQHAAASALAGTSPVRPRQAVWQLCLLRRDADPARCQRTRGRRQQPNRQELQRKPPQCSCKCNPAARY
jgi:outer membrane receptor protein involved in Fe transport